MITWQFGTVTTERQIEVQRTKNRENKDHRLSIKYYIMKSMIKTVKLSSAEPRSVRQESVRQKIIKHACLKFLMTFIICNKAFEIDTDGYTSLNIKLKELETSEHQAKKQPIQNKRRWPSAKQ